MIDDVDEPVGEGVAVEEARVAGVAGAADAPPAPLPVVVLTTVPGSIPNLDKTLQEIAARAEAAGQAIRVRMPLSLYNIDTDAYVSWEAVRFVLEFAKGETASLFREDLERFIREWVGERQL